MRGSLFLVGALAVNLGPAGSAPQSHVLVCTSELSRKLLNLVGELLQLPFKIGQMLSGMQEYLRKVWRLVFSSRSSPLTAGLSEYR